MSESTGQTREQALDRYALLRSGCNKMRALPAILTTVTRICISPQCGFASVMLGNRFVSQEVSTAMNLASNVGGTSSACCVTCKRNNMGHTESVLSTLSDSYSLLGFAKEGQPVDDSSGRCLEIRTRRCSPFRSRPPLEEPYQICTIADNQKRTLRVLAGCVVLDAWVGSIIAPRMAPSFKA